jgi:hypothetical protein
MQAHRILYYEKKMVSLELFSYWVQNSKGKPMKQIAISLIK